MIELPTQGKIIQDNRSDKSGNLAKTRNINLSKEGYIRQSPRMVSVMNEDDDADFNNVDAIINGNSGLIASGNKVFEGTIGVGTLTESTGTSAPSPGEEEGLCIFNGKKVVSAGANFLYADEGSSNNWTSVSASLSTSYPTFLQPFPGKASLMVCNYNTVKLYNTSWALTVTLTLPSEYAVVNAKAIGSRAYISTRHLFAGEGQLFVWDGNDTSALDAYPVGAQDMPAMEVYESTVVGINANGLLQRFTGGGFRELAALPIYYSDFEWSLSSSEYSRISSLGLVVDREKIFINIAGFSGYEYPRISDGSTWSGCWCYDPRFGLYHYNSPTQTTILSETVPTTDINTTTDVITVAAAPVTGTPVYYSKGASSTAIGGLTDGKLYYTIYVSGTTIKLATSASNATASTAINLTSTGDGNHTLYFIEVKDFGHTYTVNKQGIAILKENLVDKEKIGKVALASRLNVSGGKTTWNTLSVDFPFLPQRSYFQTVRDYSAEESDNASVIHVKYRPLTSDESIIVKLKTEERLGLPIISQNVSDTTSDWKGTWTDTDTFTTTVDLTNAAVGDEVEFQAGIGPLTAHISSLSESNGTWTVNLDEAFPWATANDTFYFTVDNWKKVKVIDTTTQKDVGYDSFAVGFSGKFIECKVELRGINVEVQHFKVRGKVHTPIPNV